MPRENNEYPVSQMFDTEITMTKIMSEGATDGIFIDDATSMATQEMKQPL